MHFRNRFKNRYTQKIRTMKNSLIIVLSVLSMGLYGQSDSLKPEKFKHQTLFSTKKGVGGYIGLNSKFTTLNNHQTLLTGGELGLVVAHRFNFGFEGYGSVNPVKSNHKINDSTYSYLNMGYGGLHLEPVLWSGKMIHLSFPTHLGVGALAETNRSYLNDINSENEFKESDLLETDFFMVAEPGAMVEFNVFRFMRLGAGASYRFVSGVDMPQEKNSELGGFSANFSLRLGWF
jgi:hypothetical protein